MRGATSNPLWEPTPDCKLPCARHRLSLLNTTVAQLAKWVGLVLTAAYRDVYGEETESEVPTELQLLTAPLAASEEVVALYTAGLAPVEIAMPAVLHAIGASKDEIDAAVKKAVEDADKKCNCEDEDRQLQVEDQKLQQEERKQSIAANKKREAVELEQAKANVSKTQAEVKNAGSSAER